MAKMKEGIISMTWAAWMTANIKSNGAYGRNILWKASSKDPLKYYDYVF